jgi:hypothetical protein
MPSFPANQRVVGLQRDVDRAVAALGDEVEAMVEELAEERHPRVERRGQARIRSHVVEQEHVAVVAGAEDAVNARALDDPDAALQHVVVGRTGHAKVEMTVGA